MRVVRPLPAILALALAAGAEEPTAKAPGIQLTTLANPVSDPIASANRRARLGADESLEFLSGIFSVRHPDSPIRYVWDPVECRLMFFERNEKLVFLAEGPGPAAPTVGAFGPPDFFGYRLIEGGIPEFLYMHGRLGVEEQVHPGSDGQTLKHHFRIENADYGLILAVPARWKDRVKSSTGSWSGNVIKVSKSEAKAGFTLTYDLSDPPELPEISESRGKAVSGDDQVGPPVPPPAEVSENRIEAAPGFEIRLIPAPDGQAFGSVELIENDGLVAATRSGNVLVSRKAEAGADRRWARFLGHSLPALRIRDAREMPESVLVSHDYGTARLFDTDGDGIADFFKVITGEENSVQEPGRRLIIPGWEVFDVHQQSQENPEITGLHLVPLGLNLEGPPVSPGTGSAVWIPGSICADPSPPLVLGSRGLNGSRIVVADRSTPDQWRIARVILDRVGETLQGAAIETRIATQPAGKLRTLAGSAEDESVWAVSEKGTHLAKITRNRNAPVFEVRAVHLAPDAFEFVFSQPIDRKIATGLENSSFLSSAPLKPGSEVSHRVVAAIVDSDGMTLSLRIAELKTGRLVEFDLGQIRSESGEALSHGPVFYSVNALAELPIPDSAPVQPGNSTASSEGESKSDEADADSPSSKTESSRESNDASDCL